MIKISFTPNLQRHLSLQSCLVNGSTVDEAMTEAFSIYPGLRGYVLEDQGGLRKHVKFFVNDKLIKDRKKLSDKIRDGSEIFVMQALSGG